MTYPVPVADIAEDLRGTCQSLMDALAKHDMEAAANDIDFTQALDELVFECEQCSWWCELSEMADAQHICTDCDDGEE